MSRAEQPRHGLGADFGAANEAVANTDAAAIAPAAKFLGGARDISIFAATLMLFCQPRDGLMLQVDESGVFGATAKRWLSMTC